MTRLDRRCFLKSSAALAAMAGVHWADLAQAKGTPSAEKLGWHLGCQAYSFNRFTFFEAVDKNVSVGLKYIEAYPGQKLSKEHTDGVGHGMSAAARKIMQKKLDDAGVKLQCYGVVGLSKDEKGSRQVFDFAKEMGISVIVSEPGADAFDTLDKLCEEYQISVGLHNHPKPSPYWNPDVVLERCKGHSKRIGSCADTGHWMRSDIKPLDALKKLEGHIVSFHFKDLNKFGGGAHDVPWGTGQADVKALLAEIKRQGLRCPFSIEYEHNWDNSVPEIAKCVEYFEKIAAELAG